MNFDNYLFHCSSLHRIMSSPAKTNEDLYYEYLNKYNYYKDKYNKVQQAMDIIKNKETQGYKQKELTQNNYSVKMYELQQKVEDYSKIKNVSVLSDTCKSYLIELFVTERYGRIKDIKSKYLEKGKLLQEEATTVISRIIGGYVETNVERRNDAFITGEIDFKFEDDTLVIYDTKAPWDLFTFWSAWAKEIESMYEWQGLGYLRLFPDAEKCKITKVLLNTPKKLIEKEKARLLNDFIGTNEEYEDACAQLELNMKFEDIPIEERVFEKVVYRNEEKINKIPEKVIRAREYLNNIKPGTYYEMAKTRQLYSQ